MIRTVLECVDPDFCLGLKDFLLKQDCFSISADLSFGVNSARQIIAAKPDLVVLEMPCSESFHLVDELKSVQPEVPVFLFCEHLTIETERLVLSHKIDAVFAKDEDLATFVQNAKAVCEATT